MNGTRLQTVYISGAKEYMRSPALLGLLVLVPAAYIALVSVAVPETALPVRLQFGQLTMATMQPLSTVNAIVMTPATSALIAGIAGLFLMRRGQAANSRLVIAGYRPKG